MKNYYLEKKTIDDTSLDYEFKVPLTEIMRLIETTIFNHSGNIGLDHKTMRENSNAFWVVTKIKLQFKSNIKSGDKINISTWTHPLGQVRACRDMMIKSGNTIKVKGSSEWCCLDINTRRLMKLSNIVYPDLDMVCNDKTGLEFTNMRLNVEKDDYIYTRTIRSTDIDINNHTNNLKYNFMAMDAFSVEELRNMDIKEYEIYFVNECHEGDNVDIYRKRDKDYYYIEGKILDKTIFKSVIKFKKKKTID